MLDILAKWVHDMFEASAGREPDLTGAVTSASVFVAQDRLGDRLALKFPSKAIRDAVAR